MTSFKFLFLASTFFGSQFDFADARANAAFAVADAPHAHANAAQPLGDRHFEAHHFEFHRCSHFASDFGADASSFHGIALFERATAFEAFVSHDFTAQSHIDARSFDTAFPHARDGKGFVSNSSSYTVA